jgi:16S rRNA (cytosine967-C5)-methyltransferase
MLVAHVVGPRPGEFVIDACGAPGGKSTHLAALMGDRGRCFRPICTGIS